MRCLFYTNYRSGNAGLTNGIMSVEVGVILAHLTNRLLVLEGNVPPAANVVRYDGRVSNHHPSRITDLLEMPVPWVEPDAFDLKGLESLELTDLSLMDVVLCFPNTLDLSSSDAKSFAGGRKRWLTVTGDHERVPVLRVSEDPLRPGTQEHRNNLCGYGYQFYLDQETRRSVHRLMQRMQAQRPYAELAQRVARDLGPFNAVHLRRGDFKVTYGVTTLDRKASEAIEAMDQVFVRTEPLVILTDERDDPFFAEIKLAYPHHHFIDWHILDDYGAEFSRLPRTDSLALAYLSQLVAAEAKEFIGTMTSTFTGLIQRYRGNAGKSEAFRYLWNELPEADTALERGRHAISECIPLDRGQMIEQFPGPYSWNRVSQRINPAWMREWPESFLVPEVVATGAPRAMPAAAARVLSPEVLSPHAAATIKHPFIHLTFEKLQVTVEADDAALLDRLALDLGARPKTKASNVITHFKVSTKGRACCIEQRGRSEKTFCDEAQLPTKLREQIGTEFALARHRYAWLSGAAFVKAGRGVVVVGDTDNPADSFRRALQTKGWELLDRGLFAIRMEDLMIVSLCGREETEGAGVPGRMPTPFETLVVASRAPLHVKEAFVAPLSPAAAVTALVGVSLDFRIDRDRAMNRLCRMVEKRPAAQLHFSRPQEAARVLARWADALLEVAA